MISIPSLILLLVIAAVCGAIGKAIAGGSHTGCLVSTVLGFVGAFIGSWIAVRLRLPEPLVIRLSGQAFPVLWSIIGSALLVAVVHLFRRR